MLANLQEWGGYRTGSRRLCWPSTTCRSRPRGSSGSSPRQAASVVGARWPAR